MKKDPSQEPSQMDHLAQKPESNGDVRRPPVETSVAAETQKVPVLALRPCWVEKSPP
jgi:hypothetical protein